TPATQVAPDPATNMRSTTNTGRDATLKLSPTRYARASFGAPGVLLAILVPTEARLKGQAAIRMAIEQFVSGINQHVGVSRGLQSAQSVTSDHEEVRVFTAIRRWH